MVESGDVIECISRKSRKNVEENPVIGVMDSRMVVLFDRNDKHTKEIPLNARIECTVIREYKNFVLARFNQVIALLEESSP